MFQDYASPVSLPETSTTCGEPCGHVEIHVVAAMGFHRSRIRDAMKIGKSVSAKSANGKMELGLFSIAENTGGQANRGTQETTYDRPSGNGPIEARTLQPGSLPGDKRKLEIMLPGLAGLRLCGILSHRRMLHRRRGFSAPNQTSLRCHNDRSTPLGWSFTGCWVAQALPRVLRQRHQKIRCSINLERWLSGRKRRFAKAS